VATVYRVRHLTLGTLHALKVLTQAAPDVRARLIQEGQVQAVLEHPNIVQVTDVLDVQGAPGLLMEFVEGTTLEHWLGRYDPTPDEAMALFRGICAGLGHAHGRNLVHRDLKPGNVLLALADGRLVPKVSDFGLARILQRGAFRNEIGATLGTPGYMAPEQSRDASRVDRRADLWSLGCLLYRLTVGVEPFAGEDLREILHQVETGDYVPPRALRPELPARVATVIGRLLTVDAAARPHDVAHVLAYLDGERDQLPPDGAVEPLPDPLPVTSHQPAWLSRSEGMHVARVLAEETLTHVAELAPHLRTPRRWLLDLEGAPPLSSGVTLSPTEADAVDDERHRGLVPTPVPAADARRRQRLALVAVAAVAAFVIGSSTLLGAVVGTAWFVRGGLAPEPALDRTAFATAPATPAPPAERDLVVTTTAEPKIEPPRPAAPPPPRREPRPEGSAVEYDGAARLWLEPVPGGQALHDLTAVPAGRYRILAVFEGEPEVVPAGEVVVSESGRPVALTCAPDLLRCRAGD
jgi:hypothetical protein